MLKIIPIIIALVSLPISITYSYEIVHLKFAILAIAVMIIGGYVLLHELKSKFDDEKNKRNDILD